VIQQGGKLGFIDEGGDRPFRRRGGEDHFDRHQFFEALNARDLPEEQLGNPSGGDLFPAEGIFRSVRGSNPTFEENLNQAQGNFLIFESYPKRDIGSLAEICEKKLPLSQDI